MKEKIILPADVCLNFSLFFFLHFQGLKILPRLANLLLLRMGGVWVPGTRESERIAASLSTSSACFSQENDENRERKKKVLKWEPHRWPAFSMVTDNRSHMTEVPFLFSSFCNGSHANTLQRPGTVSQILGIQRP